MPPDERITDAQWQSIRRRLIGDDDFPKTKDLEDVAKRLDPVVERLDTLERRIMDPDSGLIVTHNNSLKEQKLAFEEQRAYQADTRAVLEELQKGQQAIVKDSAVKKARGRTQIILEIIKGVVAFATGAAGLLLIQKLLS